MKVLFQLGLYFSPWAVACREAAECAELGAEWLHVDICDGIGGHTITLGPEVRRIGPKPECAVHLRL